MAIISEGLGDSLLAVLWYFVPGTIFMIPIMVNSSALIPEQLLIPIIFTVGYVIHAILRSLKSSSNNAKINSCQYLKELINVNWSDAFADSVSTHYSIKNKKYKSIVESIKRESFFHVSYAVLVWAFVLGYFEFLVNLILTKNLINVYGVVMYVLLGVVIQRLPINAKNYVELRKILMIEQCRKDIENDKEKINAIYENLKTWGMLKEDSVESSKPNDFMKQEKVTNVEKQITKKSQKVK